MMRTTHASRRTPRHRAEQNRPSASAFSAPQPASSGPRHRAPRARRTPLTATIGGTGVSYATLRRATPAVAAAIGVSVLVPAAGAAPLDPVDVTATAGVDPAVAAVAQVSTPDTASVPGMTALTTVLPPPAVPASPVLATGEIVVDGVPMLRPATGEVTSRYGMRRHPVLGTGRMHTGTDYAAGDGNIYAAADGVVTETSRSGGYGLLTVLEHPAADGGIVQTRYAHQSKFLVQPGDRVTKGQVIGRIGSTGMSTGPHLHFEVMVDGQLVSPPSAH